MIVTNNPIWIQLNYYNLSGVNFTISLKQTWPSFHLNLHHCLPSTRLEEDDMEATSYETGKCPAATGYVVEIPDLGGGLALEGVKKVRHLYITGHYSNALAFISVN